MCNNFIATQLRTYSWNVYMLIQTKSSENQSLRKNTRLKGPICLSALHRRRSMPVGNLKAWRNETPFPCGPAIDQIRRLHGRKDSGSQSRMWVFLRHIADIWALSKYGRKYMAYAGKACPTKGRTECGTPSPLKAFCSDASPQTIG